MSTLKLERTLYDLRRAAEKAVDVVEEVESKYIHQSHDMPDGCPVRKSLMNRHRISNFVRLVEQKVKTDPAVQFLLAGMVLEGVQYMTLSGAQVDLNAMDIVKKAYDHIMQGNVTYANSALKDLLDAVTPDRIAEYLKRRSL